ncbi:MAG TPA: hypothetical protein VK066_24650 [Chloroflexota bacterium]|nr:hypothetical protein [Chloroflexota bacterium]
MEERIQHVGDVGTRGATARVRDLPHTRNAVERLDADARRAA